MRCPNCQVNNPDIARYCHHCGQQLLQQGVSKLSLSLLSGVGLIAILLGGVSVLVISSLFGNIGPVATPIFTASPTDEITPTPHPPVAWTPTATPPPMLTWTPTYRHILPTITPTSTSVPPTRTPTPTLVPPIDTPVPLPTQTPIPLSTGTDSIKVTFDSYYDFIYQKDYSTAWGMISDEFKAQLGLTFDEFAKEWEESGPATIVDFIDIDESNGSTTVTLELYYPKKEVSHILRYKLRHDKVQGSPQFDYWLFLESEVLD